ncbi:Pac1p KNAG_0G02790 [Huiozyma naganishii CBS 8797]|uniref:Uncharacterized protein n=1 Tax=Huiozyma naganishii (strain ATCC MYA-139 / BCRC 22969 / CBS 8797 / KCTC 17520 / NBRC 10181 / NCYC 3082 / Yp74L-3) TaxID=1071383 RepID=J7R8Y5_HUIN7|nr:hypothetical protein KNAG_0G02790 [Kazachstania naganishii CBS 8797]CCK71335.1 hypothetical protein KNAG_0G02790 [Kazachstania naganishii CBS 8797]
MWRVPLTQTQQADLNAAVVDYVAWVAEEQQADGSAGRNSLAETVSALRQLLEVHAPPATGPSQSAGGSQSLLLPRKWNSIVQLQRKIMALEEQVGQLNSQLEALQAAQGEEDPHGPVSAPDWVPRAVPWSTISTRHPDTCIKLHPLLPLCFMGDEYGRVLVYDFLTAKGNNTLPHAQLSSAHLKGLTSLDLVPWEGTVTLATSSKDLTARIWTWDQKESTLNLQQTLLGHEHIVSQVVLKQKTENSTTLYAFTCSRDATVRIWDTDTGICVKTLPHLHRDWIRCLDVRGEYLLTGSQDTSLRLTHWPSGNAISMGLGHEFPIETVKFLPPLCDTTMPVTHCVSAGRDDVIKLWELPVPVLLPHAAPTPHLDPDKNYFTLVADIRGHSSWVKDLQVDAMGQRLYSCSDDKSVKCWDISDYRSPTLVKSWDIIHSAFVNCIAIDSYGSLQEGQQRREVMLTAGLDCKCNIFLK